MTKEQLQDYAMTIPSIAEDLWHDMQSYGFPTGSSVLGVEDPADIDWVCQLPASAFIYRNCAIPCGKFNKDYIDTEESFVPLYAIKFGKLYNIICLSFGILKRYL